MISSYLLEFVAKFCLEVDFALEFITVFSGGLIIIIIYKETYLTVKSLDKPISYIA